MEIKFNKFQKIVLVIIIFGFLCRLIPHPPNFSPVTAIALFGGLNFNDKRVAFSIPLLILFLSDLIIGISLINLFVYLGFISVVLLGSQIKSIKFGNILFASFLFFIISNFGVWLTGSFYAHNIEGLINCYTMAIPFFTNTLLSTVMFAILIEFLVFSKYFNFIPLIKKKYY